MGIENGSSYPETPRRVLIEGEPVSILREMVIDESDSCDLWDITWPESAAGIQFKRLQENYQTRGRYGHVTFPLYTANAWHDSHCDGKQIIDLTQVTHQKKCLFTGSPTGFFMEDPGARGVESNYYVIGLNPYELEDSIKHNEGTWHEIGHAILKDGFYEAQLVRTAFSLNRAHLPHLAQAIIYAGLVAQAMPRSEQGKTYPVEAFTQKRICELISDNYYFRNAMTLFKERNAWAAGYHLQTNLGYPTGFQQSLSRKQYADFCLESYAIANHDSRFVNGLHD